MAAKKMRYVAEEQHEEFEEAGFAVHFDDQLGLEEISEPRCPVCNELLAWHEEACATAPSEIAVAEEVVGPSQVVSGFAYELGHQVLSVTGTAPRVITWRGQLKERHPETGMVHRVPVYRLNDGYWDCYREEELQVA